MCVWGARERERRKQEVAGAGLAVDVPLKNRSKKRKKKANNEIALEGLDEMRRLVKASPEALLD